MAKKWTKAEREESIEILRKRLPEGTRVYLILRKVSRSGMSRSITPFIFDVAGIDAGKHPEPLYLGYHIARAVGWRLDNKGYFAHAVKIDGCGMDMGFHMVDTLSRILYGKSYALHAVWL